MTAYEMRISDWSSDVCSSDLGSLVARQQQGGGEIHHQAALLLLQRPARRQQGDHLGQRRGRLGPGAPAPVDVGAKLLGIEAVVVVQRRQRLVAAPEVGERARRELTALCGNRLVEAFGRAAVERRQAGLGRSEEHTSELQSLMRISYAVFCLKKKKKQSH